MFIPGDKSITHRALILSAISERKIRIKNWLQSLDCLATKSALEQMGVKFTELSEDTIEVEGVGLYGLRAPNKPLDCGNSGTTMRLMLGLLAAQKFDSELTGDQSLLNRPMGRVIEPLILMGAEISVDLKIKGGKKLQAISYDLPVPSAQVKSALQIADLYCENNSQINCKFTVRDHTERLLDILNNNNKSVVDIDIPNDISSAAFFVVAATICENCNLTIEKVGLNSTRTGFLDILQSMGAKIIADNLSTISGELRGDLHVSAASLHGVEIPKKIIPRTIDEIPILAIAAACALGETVFHGLAELRYKESNRLQAISDGLKEIGIINRIDGDDLWIHGGIIRGGTVNSKGDHRIAMAFMIASLVAEQEIVIQDTDNIATSYPNFKEAFKEFRNVG